MSIAFSYWFLCLTHTIGCSQVPVYAHIHREMHTARHIHYTCSIHICWCWCVVFHLVSLEMHDLTHHKTQHIIRYPQVQRSIQLCHCKRTEKCSHGLISGFLDFSMNACSANALNEHWLMLSSQWQATSSVTVAAPLNTHSTKKAPQATRKRIPRPMGQVYRGAVTWPASKDLSREPAKAVGVIREWNAVGRKNGDCICYLQEHTRKNPHVVLARPLIANCFFTQDQPLQFCSNVESV